MTHDPHDLANDPLPGDEPDVYPTVPRPTIRQVLVGSVAVVMVLAGTATAVQAFKSYGYFEWLWPAVAVVVFVVLSTVAVAVCGLIAAAAEDRSRLVDARLKSLATICGWLASTTAVFAVPVLLGVMATSGPAGEVGTIVAVTAVAVPVLLTALWWLLRRTARERRHARLRQRLTAVQQPTRTA